MEMKMNTECWEKLNGFAEQLAFNEAEMLQPGVYVHLITDTSLSELVEKRVEEDLDALTVKFLEQLGTARKEAADAEQSETVLRTAIEELVSNYTDSCDDATEEIVGELEQLLQEETEEQAQQKAQEREKLQRVIKEMVEDQEDE